MANINYKELEGRLSRQEIYTHGSSYANYNGNYYEVYSYHTLILEYDTINNGITYYNDSKLFKIDGAMRRSPTTSRLQNIIKRHYDVDSYCAKSNINTLDKFFSGLSL
jgi:hypothetical protein